MNIIPSVVKRTSLADIVGTDAFYGGDADYVTSQDGQSRSSQFIPACVQGRVHLAR